MKVGGKLVMNHAQLVISELCVKVVIFKAQEMARNITLAINTIVVSVLILREMLLSFLGSQYGLLS